MDTGIWKTISDEYKAAKKCLWCPKHSGNWWRDDDGGMYHLWRAYHLATAAEEKDSLLYARILMMMNDEIHNVYSHTRFHKYVEPAMAFYNKAIEAGDKPCEKELEKARFYYNSLKYELEMTAETSEQYEKSYSMIPGLNEIEDFQFHDSKPLHFEHDSTSAKLVLKYDSVTVTFAFEGLVEIEVNGDPTVNWINDFYCYRAFHNDKLLKFDIGYYRILCENINIVKVVRDGE